MCSFQTHMQANILHICARTTDMHSCACKAVGASACVAGCAFPHCMATRTLRNCGWVCCASAHSHIAWQRALWATIVDIVECLHPPTCTASAPRRNTQQTCVLEKRVHTCVRASHMHMPSMATYTQHTHRNTHTHTQTCNPSLLSGGNDSVRETTNHVHAPRAPRQPALTWP